MKKIIYATLTPVAIISLATIVSCANQTSNEQTPDQIDQIQVQKLISTINQINANGQFYLIDHRDLVITSDEGFKQINQTNVGSRLKASAQDWQFDQKVMEISNWTKVNEQTIQFKIKIAQIESDLISFTSPTAQVDQLIINQGLNDPNHHLILSANNAIRSGKLNQISVQEQARAISQYLVKQWKLQKISAKDDYTYQVALSANTNAAFNRVFAKNWQDVFNPLKQISNPWLKQLNQDWTNVNQVVLGIKIKETIRDLNPNGVASFSLSLDYVQISWKGNYDLPDWLLPNTTSYRYWLKDLKVDLKVKNVQGEAGTIVAI